MKKNNFEVKCLLRQFKKVQLLNKIVEDRSLAFITCTQSYRNFENKSTNLYAAHQNKKKLQWNSSHFLGEIHHIQPNVYDYSCEKDSWSIAMSKL